METALIVALVVFLFWIRKSISVEVKKVHGDMQKMQRDLTLMQQQLTALQKSAFTPPPATESKAAPKPATAAPEVPPVTATQPKPTPVPPPAAPKTDSPAWQQLMPPEPIKLPATEPAPAPKPVLKPEAEPAPKPEPIAAFSPPVTPPPAPPAPEPNFWERHPDWEKFIGENLINKLGIAILVLGIGFFVKYAIDQNWINEIGRVAIGLLSGGLLMGIAHRLRQNFAAFSSVLIGGGLAVLYFTIAIAFHEYQLFNQTVAFILMVAITGFTIFLSVAYNRIELAVLALVGGFATPFMVSTGEGNYIVLFTFILILNTGILVLAYYKKWQLLNIIAYGFTVLLFGGWLSTKVINQPEAPYLGALVFASIFYVVFFAMNIINNLKEKRQFAAPEMMILLSNTFLYYAAGMVILRELGGGRYDGLFTAFLAAFNFGFAYALFKSGKADKNLVYMLIGLVLTFLSLVAPVQLQGNQITMFWALEAVLLLWLWQKSGIKLIKLASVVVLFLMVGSLLIDWYQVYYASQPGVLTLILNKGFITSIMAVAAVGATLWLLHSETEDIIGGLERSSYQAMLRFVFVILLYLAGQLELSYQLDAYKIPLTASYLIIGLYNYFFLLCLLLVARRFYDMPYVAGITALAFLGALSYPFSQNIFVAELRDGYLLQNQDLLGYFLLHYLNLLLVVLIGWFSLKSVSEVFGLQSKNGKIMLWLCSALAVFLASAEMEHLALLSSYDPGDNHSQLLGQIRKIGWAILWGLSSFAFMLLGMTYKLKTLRIISLSLFFLTLAKLFIVDIRTISEGGKIAAFICLGVLLLVVSFMYQKLKNLILEDDRPTE